jgi:hypothetical protein
MKREIALSFLFAAWLGCAGRAPSSAPSPSGVDLSSAPLKEEFDPQVLREDLLLIQPTFPPPNTLPTQSIADRDETVSLDEPNPVPETTAPAAPSGRQVYRIQLMALSNGDVAQQRREMLEHQLGVPVRIDRERQLFVVRAGAFATGAEAEQLKARIISLSDEYADAYVVTSAERDPAPAEVPSAASAPPDSAAAVVPPVAEEADDPPPILVPAFGWRILLDKVESHERAQQLKRSAVKRLRRTDIDITFKTPFYNVEVGYYTTESAAQEALERLKGKHLRFYPNAFTVRGQIFIPQEE